MESISVRLTIQQADSLDLNPRSRLASRVQWHGHDYVKFAAAKDAHRQALRRATVHEMSQVNGAVLKVMDDLADDTGGPVCRHLLHQRNCAMGAVRRM